MKSYRPLFIIILLICFAFLCSCRESGAIQSEGIPKRIVSLSPSATEILFAIGAGDAMIARTDFCNFPDEALAVPSIGGFDGKSFSVESVILAEADFVYATRGMHDHLENPLKAHGIKVFMSDADSLESLYEEIIEISIITGNTDKGKSLVNDMQMKVSDIKTILKEVKRKTVYWEVWDSPYMSVGKKSYINDILTIAGGENIFYDINQSYPVVSEETIITRNPQVILLASDNPTTIENISYRNGWQHIDAVKDNTIFFIEADIVSRPGPRAILAMELIAKKLFPYEVF